MNNDIKGIKQYADRNPKQKMLFRRIIFWEDDILYLYLTKFVDSYNTNSLFNIKNP